MFRLGGGSATFRYWRVLVIIIESGMVYSIALVCEITLYFLNSNAFYIVYDPIAQLTVSFKLLKPFFARSRRTYTNAIRQAITPTLIIILAALQLTSSDVHSRLTRSKNANVFKARHTDGSTTMPLESIHFAANDAILSTALKSPGITGISDSSAEYINNKPDGHTSLA